MAYKTTMGDTQLNSSTAKNQRKDFFYLFFIPSRTLRQGCGLMLLDEWHLFIGTTSPYEVHCWFIICQCSRHQSASVVLLKLVSRIKDTIVLPLASGEENFYLIKLGELKGIWKNLHPMLFSEIWFSHRDY